MPWLHLNRNNSNTTGDIGWILDVLHSGYILILTFIPENYTFIILISQPYRWYELPTQTELAPRTSLQSVAPTRADLYSTPRVDGV